MKIDVVVDTKLVQTMRVRQLGALFDVPAAEHAHIEWHGDLPIEAEPWNVGLIVGPSGSGKTSILNNCFGAPGPLTWGASSVIDDFDKSLSMQQISDICQAVGFNTIPAWMRPHAVLSNGEKFRVELARRLVTTAPGIITMDEFTSVVDRQVAQIGAHAVQKLVRREKKQFVAASCHYDILDWLQPDWILEPATMSFTRRLLRPRPSLDIEIRRVGYDYWSLFAPFHYLTAELNKSAVCFCLFVSGQPAAFAGVLHFPHAKLKNLKRVSRAVTLPDWQGLGLIPILVEKLGAVYAASGFKFRLYPAHPALIRAIASRPNLWALRKRAGTYAATDGKTSSLRANAKDSAAAFGGRPCAVFEYIGNAIDKAAAHQLLALPR